jgi:CheY-like chemotaxis protein
VLINLLSNAGRFTEKGGVRVSAERSGPDVRISVADTGPGISPEDQRRVFEPFRQLDSSIRRRHGGSGLGLAISKRFVEMHGGRMWLESRAGLGTTFHFCLPAGAPTSLPDGAADVRRWFGPYVQHEARTRRSKVPLPRPSPRFVLLDSGDALPRIFGRYVDDVEVVAVRDVAGAMAELSRSAAQALVVNAPAALDGVARLPYGIPAVTCWVPGSDEAARQLGVVRYLVKPVTRQVLLSTLAGLGDRVRTVLLVDDEPEALQLFARMLASANRSYDVLLARSGQRALALLREHRPDVVLLDLVMPGMDGYRLLQEKRQDPSVRDIPVVVVSSRDPGGEPLASDTLTVTRAGGLLATPAI